LQVAFCSLAIVALVVGCSQLPLDTDETRSPNVLDKIRSIDLLPRQPRDVEANNQNTGRRAQAQVFAGEEIMPVAPARTSSGGTGEGFDLNFEGTPIATVAKVVLGDILGTGYIIDPRVQGTISLASVRPVPKSDLLFVLENALRPNGIALVKDTAGYRLVPSADAVGAGNIDSAAARAEPGYGVSVVPLQHISAQTLLKLLDSFATKPGTVRADTARNLLLIQGSGADRRAAIETALSFDVDWMRGQSVGIFPVQNSSPEPIITELEKILDTAENGMGQNAIKMQAVDRMNAILVVTRKPALLRSAERWIDRLDNADTSRAGVRVYRVKYGDARQIARVLNEVFTGNVSSSLDSSTSQIAPGSGMTSASSSERLSLNTNQSSTGFGGRTQSGLGGGLGGGLGSTGPGSSQSTLGTTANAAAATTLGARGSSSSGSGQAVLQGVRITADAVNNSLLIYASQENYRIIEQTLRQVDRPQLQVSIDATVAEVTLNDTLAYGVQTYLTSKNLGLKPDQGSILNTQRGSNSNSTAGAIGAAAGAAANAFLSRTLPGFNFLIGPEAQPSMILDALHTVTNVKVLSNPSVVVIDNQVATLQVGDQVPVSTGSATVLTANNTVVNTIDYRNTGIILRVVPRVNANGNVRLEIEQEISNVSNTPTANTLTPTVSERKVKSSIAVASGQTVLLAGLISERQSGDRTGIPLIDQIPFLGDAASHTGKGVTRTELIIFIRPQIIRDGVDAHYVAEELRSKLRGTLGANSQVEPAAARIR
jgi:general secretion pathway protein D